MRVIRPVEERFWAKVDKRGPDECWLWTGYRNDKGYGQIMLSKTPTNVVRLVHRLSYIWALGPIPDGLVLDHTCHNRACVNPAHLQAVTQKQNLENASLSRASTSGVRGVSWDRRSQKWRARVVHHKREYWAGLHSSLEDAEVAVIAKRNELYTNNLLDREAA